MSKKTIMTDIITSLLLVALFFGLPFFIFSLISKIQTSVSKKNQLSELSAIYLYLNEIWTSESLYNKP